MKSSPIFDKTLELIQDRLNLTSESQKLVSGNLANVGTPGYKARHLTFRETLEDSIQQERARLAAPNPRHMEIEEPASSIPSEIEETGAVSLEQEMLELAKNSIDYQYMVTMLNKKFAMLRQAIDGGN